MSERITVATANTHFGKMVEARNGLNPIAHADVITLQEVIEPAKYGLKEKLEDVGFTLVHLVGAYGLAIAVRQDSGIRAIEDTNKAYSLQKRQKASSSPRIHRGVIVSDLVSPAGNTLTTVTTHPSVAFAPWARRAELREMRRVLASDDQLNPNLIVTADFNTYPRAGRFDLDLRADLGLQTVDIGDQPTWPIRGSKHAWLGYAASALTLGKRKLDDFSAQLDAIAYRGFVEIDAEVIPTESDHHAIVATLEFIDHTDGNMPADAPDTSVLK